MIHALLRTFLRLLYHQFAWSYDLVAGAVSLGRWKEWVFCALPYLEGRVLEIGPGPGHLQAAMHRRGLAAFGLDESRQMCRQSARRLRRLGTAPTITRGCAQDLPFPANSFDCVTATFPAEFFLDVQTLAEEQRVIKPGGRLVLLPMAWITRKGWLERIAAWLFKASGQAGEIETVLPSLYKRIQGVGFVVRHELVEVDGSRVLVILAGKPVKGNI